MAWILFLCNVSVNLFVLHGKKTSWYQLFFCCICLICLENSDLVPNIHVWIVVIKIGIVMNKKSNHWRSRDKFQYKYVFCNYGSLTYSVVKCHNWQRNVSSLATSFYSLIIVDLWHTVLSNEPIDKGMSIN
jgi:hypothetical protein